MASAIYSEQVQSNNNHNQVESSTISAPKRFLGKVWGWIRDNKEVVGTCLFTTVIMATTVAFGLTVATAVAYIPISLAHPSIPIYAIALPILGLTTFVFLGFVSFGLVSLPCMKNQS